MNLVAGFIDIYIARRVVSYRSLGYSSIVYSMFNLMKELRGKNVSQIVSLLKDKVQEMDDDGDTTFDNVIDFSLHNQNKRKIHILLARMTYHIEISSGLENNFENYVSHDIQHPYQVEHIWANVYDRHQEEFDNERDFEEYRNNFGGLLLLPANFNQSYNDYTYEDKIDLYFSQNLLARTLNSQCYQNNPGFLRYIDESEMPFKAHSEFKMRDLDERQDLYKKICEEIWNIERFDLAE